MSKLVTGRITTVEPVKPHYDEGLLQASFSTIPFYRAFGAFIAECDKTGGVWQGTFNEALAYVMRAGRGTLNPLTVKSTMVRVFADYGLTVTEPLPDPAKG